MNITNWLLIFMVSLVTIGALGYLTNRVMRRPHKLWSTLSLALASLICATMFATLFVQSPMVATMQAATAGDFTCLGTPALVRAGDPIAITGQGEAGSSVAIWQEKTTLASTTIDKTGDYALEITVTTPGVQTVLCQLESDGQVQSIQLSFLVIGQAAALPTAAATNTSAPTATKTIAHTAPPTQTLAPTAPPTNTPAPTATKTIAPTEPPATDTPEPTATTAPTVAAPVVDLESIPAEILPGETFRLQGTAAGSSRVRVAINNKVVGGAVSGTDGGWRTTIGFASAGTYTVTAQLVENDVVVAESEPISVTVLEPAATNTPEPTATNTVEPTATTTNTTAPTATNTSAPTATATNTVEPTATTTNTSAPTATNTSAPTATATNTAEPTATATNTAVPTATLTNTPAPTNTPIPTATSTNTPAPTATNTPEPTATNTPAPTNTNTPEPTATTAPTVAAPVVDLESIPAEILPGETFRLQGTAAGSARVRVTINNKVVGGAVSGTDGGWRTTIGFASAGTYTVTAQLVENDVVVAESDPLSVTVLEPAPTLAPTATAVPTLAPTNTAEPTATNTAIPAATVEPTATVAAAAAATIAPSQPMTDTVAVPADLPGTGSDFSQGVPWVVLLLLIGAGLTLGIGQLSKKSMV